MAKHRLVIRCCTALCALFSYSVAASRHSSNQTVAAARGSVKDGCGSLRTPKNPVLILQDTVGWVSDCRSKPQSGKSNRPRVLEAPALRCC